MLLLASDPASAQDHTPKFSKEMHVYGPKDIGVARMNIFQPNADCVDARLELVLVNGEVALALREIQKIDDPPGIYRGRMGGGKMRYVIGRGACRIVVSVEPEVSTTPKDK